jgi:dsRNA-specific ribonuclease
MSDKHSTTKRDDTMGNVFTDTERYVTEISDGEKRVRGYGSSPEEAERIASEKADELWEDEEL